MKRLIFWLITFAAILGAWFSMPRAETNIPREYVMLTPPGDLDSSDTLAAGRDIYLANCASCHGTTGNGQGTTRPSFGPKPADFTDRQRMQKLLPQYLFWRISEGGRIEPFRAQGSIMPAWKHPLTVEQRWQVIAYIRTLSR